MKINQIKLAAENGALALIMLVSSVCSACDWVPYYGNFGGASWPSLSALIFIAENDTLSSRLVIRGEFDGETSLHRRGSRKKSCCARKFREDGVLAECLTQAPPVHGVGVAV